MAAFPGPSPSPWAAAGGWPARAADDGAQASPPLPSLDPALLPPGLSLRRLGPADRQALEAQHATLFPVDYEPAFYTAVTTGSDGVFGAGLFETGGDGALVAFATARAVPWWELSAADAAALGLSPPPGALSRDGTPHTSGGPGAGPPPPAPPSPVAAVYVLTLGVGSPAHRRSGAGRVLMAAVAAAASAWGARAVYLHVAAFNTDALAFYASLGRGEEGGGGEGGRGAAPAGEPSYLHARTLPAFYSIPKRPPVPGVTRYDAHLLVARVEEGGGVGGRPPPSRCPPPAWSRASPLASPPLLTPAEAEGGGRRGQPAAGAPPSVLAGWARAVWERLPPAPAWARRLFRMEGGGGGGGGAGEGGQRAAAPPRPRPPVVVGDVI